MGRPREDTSTYADDEYDDPDTNVGDYVLARKMKDVDAYKADDAPDVQLYYQETTLKTGPLWVTGCWDGAHERWMTGFGYLGVPIAWAPVPKTPEDWA